MAKVKPQGILFENVLAKISYFLVTFSILGFIVFFILNRIYYNKYYNYDVFASDNSPQRKEELLEMYKDFVTMTEFFFQLGALFGFVSIIASM